MSFGDELEKFARRTQPEELQSKPAPEPKPVEKAGERLEELEWTALKKAAVERGWPTTAFDYGHEPKSMEEALAWKHWDESDSWVCNECGQDATDGLNQRATFLDGWKQGYDKGLKQGEEERETFLAEHDENVRLHTDLAAAREEVAMLRKALVQASLDIERGDMRVLPRIMNALTCTYGPS